MKKILILLFILVFSISFFGCNKDESYADCDKEIQEVLAQYGEPTFEQHATSENT
jgi:ABC-type cobalt transport system substrate-binding protein